MDRVKLKPEFKRLKTVPGIGSILELTIMLRPERSRDLPVSEITLRCAGPSKIHLTAGFNELGGGLTQGLS
jgi:hypothetical protein